jgi:hypothetical protein
MNAEYFAAKILKLLQLAYLLSQSFFAEFRQTLDRTALCRLWPGAIPQNLESSRLTGKVLFSKNLSAGANAARCACRQCDDRRLSLWKARSDVTSAGCGKGNR